MTGDELINNILEIRNDIPVILCSGFKEDLSESETIKADNVKFLQKPVESQILVALTRKLLNKLT